MSEPRHHILVVDDREQNRYVLSRMLQRAGYECEEARTGREALERVRALPDLVILDVHLPDLTGTEVCRRIKNDPLTAHIAVLQISAAFVSGEDKAKALDDGADGYLTHPIDSTVLEATVRSLLRLRKAEIAAHQAAAQWQSTFDSLQEGLAVVDAEGRLVRMNTAFAEICRRAGAYEIGEPASDVLRHTFGTDEPLMLAATHSHSAEVQLGEQSFQLRVDPLYVDESPPGRILVLTDITDRKLADYALRTAEKLAATGNLAQALAHEINNPLEAVMNLIYLAQAATTQNDVKSYLDSASNELGRIGRITKQSLSFHRDTLQPTAIDVSDIVKEVVEMYSKQAAARQVRIVFDHRPGVSINGFPGQLRQVFGNLIRNAVEASPSRGDVTVRMRVAQRSSGRGARVTVHDRGAGIPSTVQNKVFNPFFTTKELKGSGLGLWVSKTIISNHGGTLRFHSRTQNGSSGTSFEVFLPVGM
ncbi:MAG: ATP-binding protein [Candidatus Korobacteraceae bacterium]